MPGFEGPGRESVSEEAQGSFYAPRKAAHGAEAFDLGAQSLVGPSPSKLK